MIVTGEQVIVYQSEIVLVEEGWKRTAGTVAIPSYGGKKRRNTKIWRKQGVTVEDVACEDVGVTTSKGERENRPFGRILYIYIYVVFMHSSHITPCN